MIDRTTAEADQPYRVCCDTHRYYDLREASGSQPVTLDGADTADIPN
jgi:hypothetical protein